MKFLLVLPFLFCACILKSQTIFVIENVPAHYTPLFDTIYLSSDLNNWNEADSNYRFTKSTNGKYYLNFNSNGATTINFKFTRGSWSKVETTLNGSFLPNRSFSFTSDTSYFSIAQWDDMIIGNNTSTSNVFSLKTDFNIPELNRSRDIWIYLPDNYYSGTINYPVLYMQDAQNIFDGIYSFAGEWNIDWKLDSLKNNGIKDCIVVGINNGESLRLDEYSAFVNSNYGGGEGNEYVDFIANTLKPFIDSTFRTLPQQEHTGIAGSSMGALISLYAGLKYQNIFGRIGIFSPSLWFSDSIFNYASSITHTNLQKIYFIAGSSESSDMIPDINQMNNILISSGYSSNEISIVSKPDGQHSEWFWRREFPACYTWLDLWGDNPTQVVIDEPQHADWSVVDSGNILTIYIKNYSAKKLTLSLTDITGKMIFEQKINNQKQISISKSGLLVGSYFLSLVSENKKSTKKISIIR